MLVTAVVGLAGAQAAHAEPHPDHRPTYRVTADLDGRLTPDTGEEAIAEEDFLRLQTTATPYFVPDRYMETGTDGPAPELRTCTKKDLAKVTRPPDPYPPTHP